MKNCHKCGSDKIVPDVKVLDRGDGSTTHDLKIAVDENPRAFIFKKRNYSDVKANVCVNCEYTHFFATDSILLWEAYQRKQNNVG